MRVLYGVLLSVSLGVVALGAVAADQPPVVPDAKLVTFHITAQPMDKALRVFAEQTRYQVMYYSSQIEDAWTSPTVTGEFKPEEALKQIISGAPLTYRFTNPRAVIIRRTDGVKTSANEVQQVYPEPGERIRLTRAETSPSLPGSGEEGLPSATATEDASQRSEEKKKASADMTVTGTQIRGVAPVGSQVLTFTREDFERAGATTPQQFLATLTQNFGGDQSDDGVNAPAANRSGASDLGIGSGVNLRGLGSGATLVLLNGRRMSTSGAASYNDIGLFPLSAVDRIEVMTDGASAIYGSDAIGGVVNVILRKDYTGAQTKLLGGTTSHGDGQEYQAAQSVGAGWGSGSALLSYEYYRRQSINALDREYSKGDGLPFDLIPQKERQSVSLTADQSLSQRVKLSATGLYSSRNSKLQSFNSNLLVNAGLLELLDAFYDTDQVNGALGLEVKLHPSWLLSVDASSSETKINALAGSSTTTDLSNTFDATLSGPLFRLPAGRVQWAMGAAYTGQQAKFVTSTRRYFSRSQKSLFSELVVPILARHQGVAGEQSALKFSLAARYEDYSDFGETFDPKVGMEWSPLTSLRVRGSWGTSFKAPSLYSLSEYNSTYQILPLSGINSLLLSGNSASLHEETATSWSIGLDFTPQAGPQVHLNYFDIDYEDKIGTPSSTPVTTLLQRLRDAGLAVQRGDIPETQFNARAQELLNSSPFLWAGCTAGGVRMVDSAGRCSLPVSGINAIVDRRVTNLAAAYRRGIDLALIQHLKPGIGDIELGFNATYLIHAQERVTSATPIEDLVDTPYKPLKFRARAGATWSGRSASISSFVNYSGKYRNTLDASNVTDIASWTTVDLTARYGFGETQGWGRWLKGTALLLSVLNVGDVPPPYMANPTIAFSLARLNYDQANADPFGRVYSLAITRDW